MNAFDRWHDARVSEHGTAILMRIGELLSQGGITFDAARAKALKEHSIPFDISSQVHRLASTYDWTDIEKNDRTRASERIFRLKVDGGMVQDNWMNRLLWRLFGITW